MSSSAAQPQPPAAPPAPPAAPAATGPPALNQSVWMSRIARGAVMSGKISNSISKINSSALQNTSGAMLVAPMAKKHIVWKAPNRAGILPGAAGVPNVPYQPEDVIFGMSQLYSIILKAQGPYQTAAVLTQAEQAQWRTFISSGVSVIFPGLIPTDITQYDVRDMSDGVCRELIRLNMYINGNGANPDLAGTLVLVNKCISSLSLPPVTGLTEDHIRAVVGINDLTEMMVVNCVDLFIAGKHSDQTQVATSIAQRLNNLANKFNNGSSYKVLSATEMPSLFAVKAIEYCWGVNSSFRKAVIEPVVSSNATSGGQLGEMIGTITQLLQYAGMASVSIINESIAVCPHLCGLPSMQTYLALYESELDVMAGMAPELRPYLKLIYGDRFKLLDSKTLMPLTQLSIQILLRNDPQHSVAGYGLPVSNVAFQTFLAYEAALQAGGFI